MKKIKGLKQVSLILAVLTLVLGFVPLPSVSRVGTIYADSTTESSDSSSQEGSSRNELLKMSKSRRIIL